jgi:hypothetical protein
VAPRRAQSVDALACAIRKHRPTPALPSTPDVLPGHAIVLSTSSAWMRRQIESWGAAENAPPPGHGGAAAAAAPGRHPTITLDVRPGQEEAARRLVQFIYEGPSSMPAAAAAAAQGAAGQACQALLVDMLALSHAFRVPT